jgi:hypothetical protein
MLRRAVVVLLLLVIGADLARGADVYVNPATGNDANDGLTPGASVRTIQRGLNLLGPAGTVHLAAGDYRASLGQVFPARSLAISRDVTVLGAGSGTTILDGEDAFQVLSLDGDKVQVEGLTILRGDSAIGGCLYVGEPITLSVIDVELQGCNAAIGGALHVQQNSRGTSALVRQCRFIRNTAAIGAGIQYQINPDGVDATLVVEDTVFIEQAASIGGAIQFQENGNGHHVLNVTRSLFRECFGAGAGGVHFQRNAGTAAGEFRECFFTGCDAALVARDASIDVVNCTFTGNGTAFEAGSTGSVGIVNGIFWGNGRELVGSAGSVSW